MSRSLYAQLHARYGPKPTLASRRDFLKGTLAVGTALLLSGCKPLVEQKVELALRSKRVLVIGGGFAGLTCAYELRAQQYDVTLVEARDRLGGRVLTFSDFASGHTVEGGGELIGSNHPLWAAYARQFNLELFDLGSDDALGMPLVLGGHLLTDAEAKTLYGEMSAALNLMNNDARPIDADQPWKSTNAVALDNKSMADWLGSIQASARCKSAVAAQLEGNNGVPLDLQSYLGNLAQIKGGGVEHYWTDSENRGCRGGNQQLATALANAIGLKRILLSTLVKEIELTDVGVAVSTADGLRLEADDLVLAVPPTIWPKITFSPELPPALNPQMGTAVKYLAEVKSRFWQENRQSADAQTDGEISMTWDATAGQPGDAPFCLTAFSGGPAAEKCRAIDRDSRDREYALHLGEIFSGFSDNFVRSRFMDWPSDANTRCGYSFPSPGQVTTVGPQLRRGIEDQLHFAGEHTCYKFVGYMEGALDSGARVAREIFERDRARELEKLTAS